MPWASHCRGTLENECEALVTKWFQRPVETVGGAKDFSAMSVLQWRGRYHVKYPEIANLARRRDVPLAKNPSMGTAQQRLFLVLKVVLYAVVVISEVLRLSTKSRCSRCCRHISSQASIMCASVKCYI